VTARLEGVALGYGYPDHPVGRDVSIALSAGEIVCLLGPNGGGKSTLFRTLLGLLPAQGGEVRLDGDPLASLSRAAIAKRVSYVPQAHAGYFPFTMRDVVLMGRTAHLSPFAAPGKRDVDIADACLVKLGLASLADQVYTRVSGGERQLALIARALAQEAPILVMDEPTASLDFGNQAMVLGRIRDLAREGYGIVLSTHDPDHALLVATRVAVIAAGGLRAVGAPADVVTAEMLSSIYRTEVIVEDTPSGRRVCVPAWGRVS